ncbi:MAG: hypothetical protein ABR526_13185 [Chthoniobacterales bacterium]
MTNRRVESASSAAVDADILARASVQMILSDVEAEIVGGSAATNASPAIYTPKTPQQMVPSRVLATNAMATDSNFNALVKQSTGRFFPSAGYSRAPLITSDTGVTTSTVSADNRVISSTRWNAPALNVGGFSATGQLPHWINVDRTGIAATQTQWSSALRDYTPGNDSAVIGRFAFNVYDVGGLLDANVAGYPIFSTALTSSDIQTLKSTQTGAALFEGANAIIPDFDSNRQTALVTNWRFNSNSASNFFSDFMSKTTLPSTTISPTFADSGFMRPTVRSATQSNTIAYTREDLIRMTTTSSAYLTTNSLPYLTHFSRELNAPSWSPTTPTGSTIDYAAQADQANAVNRNIPNVRVTTPFIRADGTQARVGEPLLKNRFPLRRLDGIGTSGVNSSAGTFPVMVAGVLQYPTTTTVQRDTGLIWNTGQNRWDYVGATGATVQASILRLDQVAAAGREPNFFEILKAFILSGSIGLGSDNSGTGRTFVNAEMRYYQAPLSSDSQVIQIGANIIDQWDADKNPTSIYFNTDEIAGVENLPYLQKLLFKPRWTSGTAFAAWLVPSFWTSPQNAVPVNSSSTSPNTPTSTIPAVRLVMTSGTAAAAVQTTGGGITAVSSIVSGSATQPLLQLPSGTAYGPTPDAAQSFVTRALFSSDGNSRLGITFTFPSMGGATKATTSRAYPIISNASFEMQAQIGSSTGPWKTYQRWTGCTVNTPAVTAACDTSASLDWGSTTIYDPEFVVLDPRTSRFGVWETHASGTTDAYDYTHGYNETLDRVVSGGAPASNFQPISSFGPQGTHFAGVGPQMANNGAALTTAFYSDLDGVRRAGDALNSGDTSAILPGNFGDRPPTLSRSTRTVAELGTVSRDQPYKTLNFSTSSSGDAGLLDAFTIFEPNSIFRSDITAGKISLNTRQAPVLAAVLSGISTVTTGATTMPAITAAQRNAIATALINMTSAQPMLNKSELVTRLAADNSVTSLGSKEAREAVIRALSDVGQTRTWNLMVDVVAQAGRYGTNASSLDQFIVQGEKRYWLHVAIDRFTGELIDQQLEAVYE